MAEAFESEGASSQRAAALESNAVSALFLARRVPLSLETTPIRQLISFL